MLDYEELRRSSAMAEEREEAFETKGRTKKSLRITPGQRFILALMLFLDILVLGCLLLLATDRIVLPF
ncbi:MAG: hypothetical protein JXA42_07315 [Anaerolineales bacterium]|nr:hypothetical protein [Anaerolineales bacterium]